MMEDGRCKKEEVFDGRCIQMFDVLWMMEDVIPPRQVSYSDV